MYSHLLGHPLSLIFRTSTYLSTTLNLDHRRHLLVLLSMFLVDPYQRSRTKIDLENTVYGGIMIEHERRREHSPVRLHLGSSISM